MKKKLLVAIFFVIAISLLTGCGKKPASNSTLKSDLTNDSIFSRMSNQLGIKITDLEVVKRQTTEERRSDVVWVKVNAAGKAVEGEMYYVMTYELYNEGWQLEYIAADRPEQWQFTPLESVSEESVPQDLIEYLAQAVAEKLPSADFQIESFDINERQAYVDADAYLTNTLYVAATTVDDAHGIRVDGEYTMTYYLNNDEWDLDAVYAAQENITPTRGIDPESILIHLENNTDFDELIYVSSDPLFSDRTEYHYVQGIKRHAYMTESYLCEVSCSFEDIDLGWHIKGIEKQAPQCTWDAAGQWSTSGTKIYYKDWWSDVESVMHYSISATVGDQRGDAIPISYTISDWKGKNYSGETEFDLSHADRSNQKGSWQIIKHFKEIDPSEIDVFMYVALDAEQGLYFYLNEMVYPSRK